MKKKRIAWNKGLKGVQVAWNKGLTKHTSKRMKAISDNLTGRTQTPAHVENMRQARLGKSYKGMGAKKGSKPWNKGLTKETDERLMKLSKKVSGRTLTESHKKNIGEAGKGRVAWNKGLPSPRKGISPSEATKKKISISHMGIGKGKAPWNKGLTKEDPRIAGMVEARRANGNYVYSDKSKAQMSASCKKNWLDPAYVKMQSECRAIVPNKAELKLDSVLQRLLPGEYKYVGNFEFTLAGKCPDFLNINGQKKLIELFGDYWHKGDDGADRVELFKRYGYKTLIIWERELKDIESLEKRLYSFNSY